MKLESLKNEKFSQNLLKREHLFKLNGGNCKTSGGRAELIVYGKRCIADYGYDIIRSSTGATTYHDRTVVKYLD